VENKKELHYCEKCKKETWFAREDTLKRGSICPTGCLRNFLIYLGEDEEEISKRKEEFILKEGYTFEVNPKMDEYEEPYTTKRTVRKVEGEEWE
jgi:hypothetical protein